MSDTDIEPTTEVKEVKVKLTSTIEVDQTDGTSFFCVENEDELAKVIHRVKVWDVITIRSKKKDYNKIGRCFASFRDQGIKYIFTQDGNIFVHS